MKIAKIEPAGRMDVYNMEVETTHDFAVANGIIVHNCYDEMRYGFMEHPIAPRVNEAERIDLNDPLNQRETHKPIWNY